MKITVTEAFVKEAIENHLRDLVTVEDNQRVDMDFRSTRADGVTVDIEIVDADAPTKGAKTKAPKKPATLNADGSAPKKRGRKSKAELEALAQSGTASADMGTAPVEADTSAEAQVVDQVETPATAETEVEAVTEAAPVSAADDATDAANVEASEEVPADKPKSLFSGLNQPKN